MYKTFLFYDYFTDENNRQSVIVYSRMKFDNWDDAHDVIDAIKNVIFCEDDFRFEELLEQNEFEFTEEGIRYIRQRRAAGLDSGNGTDVFTSDFYELRKETGLKRIHTLRSNLIECPFTSLTTYDYLRKRVLVAFSRSKRTDSWRHRQRAKVATKSVREYIKLRKRMSKISFSNTRVLMQYSLNLGQSDLITENSNESHPTQ